MAGSEQLVTQPFSIETDRQAHINRQKDIDTQSDRYSRTDKHINIIIEVASK